VSIVETVNEDRCYKQCRCCVCEKVRLCTPSFDFYSTEDHGDKLVCESCFTHYVREKLSVGSDRKHN